jgi:hypothetical protein
MSLEKCQRVSARGYRSRHPAATAYRLNRLRSAFLARLIQQLAQRRELFGHVGVPGKHRLVRGRLYLPGQSCRRREGSTLGGVGMDITIAPSLLRDAVEKPKLSMLYVGGRPLDGVLIKPTVTSSSGSLFTAGDGPGLPTCAVQ